MPFYAVAFGKTRGVMTKWDDCKKSIAQFPQPVYKKFETQEEAEKFLKEYEPQHVDLGMPNNLNHPRTLYTVARGKVVGIFYDFEEVKEYVAGYPKPMYKKHSSYAEALAYFNKYNKVDEGIGNVSTETKEPESDGDAEDFKSVSSDDDESPNKNEKRRHTEDEEKASKNEKRRHVEDEEKAPKDEKASEEEGLQNDVPKKKVKSN